MTGFDPGEGWRRLADDEIVDAGAEVIHYSTGDGMRAWVRMPAVPPLPTEPYTVIRVTWAKRARKGAQDILINELGGWCDLEGTIYARKAAAESISGFEVLAEPRAVTAKAVLDQVREALPLGADGFSQDCLTIVGREFGVSTRD